MTDPQFTSVITLLGTIFTGIMAYFMARLNHQATKAAKDREETRDTLHTSTSHTKQELEYIKGVADKTHVLVNGGMLAQLRITSILAQRLATFPGATEEDKEAARLASKLYLEHKNTEEMISAKADHPMSSMPSDEDTKPDIDNKVPSPRQTANKNQ